MKYPKCKNPTHRVEITLTRVKDDLPKVVRLLTLKDAKRLVISSMKDLCVFASIVPHLYFFNEEEGTKVLNDLKEKVNDLNFFPVGKECYDYWSYSVYGDKFKWSIKKIEKKLASKRGILRLS